MSNSNSQRRKYFKALETVVYLANKDQRQYWVLKAIYLADKQHLQRYGRQIFGDRYVAMKLGPVPSLAYDIVKSVRGDDSAAKSFFPEPTPDTALNVVADNVSVKPSREANKDILSTSEMECLDHAYATIKDLSFEQLKQLTHDSAYDATGQNDDMSITKIIETLENSADVLDYQRNR